ncbi:hypothetical protein R8Z50_31715 [Longispora sp. K20-0274]|uniref:hypothetical protein n=1 Tax=Longispora sp. K20-0274 TaxID=3088255 RepID=UPI003999C2E6
MWVRRSVLLLAVATVTLTGCDGGDPPAPAASTAVSASPPAPPTPAASASASTAASKAAPAGTPTVTCAEVRTARVRGSKPPYSDFGEAGVPLVDGAWSGPGGLTLAAQAPCATGNLDPHGGISTLATIMSSTTGTTGRFWGLMLCKKESGAPVCTVTLILNDREPVQSVSVGGQKATVVYLTRTPDVPPAGLNRKRTAVYQFGNNTLLELSHTDEAYTP